MMVDYFNQIIHWTGLNLQINFVFIKKKKYEDYPGLLASTHLAPSVLTSGGGQMYKTFLIYFDLFKTNKVYWV